MIPVSPVLPDSVDYETVFAKNQPEYLPLPAVKIGHADDGIYLTRWRMTWRERWRAFVGGNVYLQLMTFNRPLQPVKLMIEAPEIE